MVRRAYVCNKICCITAEDLDMIESDYKSHQKGEARACHRCTGEKTYTKLHEHIMWHHKTEYEELYARLRKADELLRSTECAAISSMKELRKRERKAYVKKTKVPAA